MLQCLRVTFSTRTSRRLEGSVTLKAPQLNCRAMCKWEMLAPPPAHACKRKWGKCDKCSGLLELSGHDRWYMIAAHFCLGSSAPGENAQPDTPDGTFSKSVQLIPFICRPKSPFKREMSEKGKRVQKLNWKTREPSITSHMKQPILCTVSRSVTTQGFIYNRKAIFSTENFLVVLKTRERNKKKKTIYRFLH